MNEYIFYTPEGWTTPPNDNMMVENCQVLGVVSAKNKQEASEQLIKENPWIKSSGFDISQAICAQILSQGIRKDILSVVDYLCEDEETHFEEQETEDRQNHIFNILKRLAKV